MAGRVPLRRPLRRARRLPRYAQIANKAAEFAEANWRRGRWWLESGRDSFVRSTVCPFELYGPRVRPNDRDARTSWASLIEIALSHDRAVGNADHVFRVGEHALLRAAAREKALADGVGALTDEQRSLLSRRAPARVSFVFGDAMPIGDPVRSLFSLSLGALAHRCDVTLARPSSWPDAGTFGVVWRGAVTRGLLWAVAVDGWGARALWRDSGL